jgi:uncharacterized membrane protein
MNHKIAMDYILSAVLRSGLFLAIAMVLYGACLLLWQSGFDMIDYRIYDGEPAFLKEGHSILEGIIKNDSLSFIQLGIIILIAMPILRVFFCLILFAAGRDLLYVMISTVVLGILLYVNY